jgi:hypothetical protein
LASSGQALLHSQQMLQEAAMLAEEYASDARGRSRRAMEAALRHAGWEDDGYGGLGPPSASAAGRGRAARAARRPGTGIDDDDDAAKDTPTAAAAAAAPPSMLEQLMRPSDDGTPGLDELSALRLALGSLERLAPRAWSLRPTMDWLRDHRAEWDMRDGALQDELAALQQRHDRLETKKKWLMDQMGINSIDELDEQPGPQQQQQLQQQRSKSAVSSSATNKTGVSAKTPGAATPVATSSLSAATTTSVTADLSPVQLVRDRLDALKRQMHLQQQQHPSAVEGPRSPSSVHRSVSSPGKRASNKLAAATSAAAADSSGTSSNDNVLALSRAVVADLQQDAHEARRLAELYREQDAAFKRLCLARGVDLDVDVDALSTTSKAKKRRGGDGSTAANGDDDDGEDEESLQLQPFDIGLSSRRFSVRFARDGSGRLLHADAPLSALKMLGLEQQPSSSSGPPDTGTDTAPERLHEVVLRGEDAVLSWCAHQLLVLRTRMDARFASLQGHMDSLRLETARAAEARAVRGEEARLAARVRSLGSYLSSEAARVGDFRDQVLHRIRHAAERNQQWEDSSKRFSRAHREALVLLQRVGQNTEQMGLMT